MASGNLDILVYHYDPVSYIYQELWEPADESPLEPGKYLVPAFATTVCPPPIEEGWQAKWIGDHWELSEKRLEDDPTVTNVTYPFEDITPERQLRDTRRGKLRSSDWTQLPDVPLDAKQKEAWGKYRQELRDLPSQQTAEDIELTNIVWPNPPT